MYAHERTMLAKLGFADPDRREQMHDIACQYLATADAIERFVRHLAIEYPPKPWHDSWDNIERTGLISRQVVSHDVTHEYEISKGIDQYRTTIGFADLVLTINVEEKRSSIRQRKQRRWDDTGMGWSDWQMDSDSAYQYRSIHGIEVKIKPTAVGDIIRQLRLYRSYSNIRDWTVATAFDLSASDIASLQNENIRHLRLGKRFDEYVVSRQTDDVVATVEI